MQENLSSVFANNNSADQPGHPPNLIKGFVIHLLESTLSKLATSKFSIFKLVSVAEETCLSLVLSKALKRQILWGQAPFNLLTKTKREVRSGDW